MFFFCSMSHPSLSDADLAYQRETLRELTDIGMDLAQALRREVFEAPEGARPVSGEVALSFSRIARAVLLTLALDARLMAGPPAEAQAPRQAERAFDPTYGITRENHPYILLGAYKKAVKRVVGDQIAAETTDTIEAERLTRSLYERLYEYDDDKDLVGLPIGELINRIRTDLGMPALDEPWTEEERSKFRPQMAAAKAAREERERQAGLANPGVGAPWRQPRPAPA
jgi:hypothetical protein